MGEPEPLLQLGRGVDVQGPLADDLDADQATLASSFKHPGDLEAADSQLVGDLDLGLVLQEVAPRDGSQHHQLGRSVVDHVNIPLPLTGSPCADLLELLVWAFCRSYEHQSN